MGIEYGWKGGLKRMKGGKKEGQKRKQQAMWLFALISVHLLTLSFSFSFSLSGDCVIYPTDPEIHTIDQPCNLVLWQLFQ